MRPRERILANLESIYRESYDRAKSRRRRRPHDRARQRLHARPAHARDPARHPGPLLGRARPRRAAARWRSSKPSAGSPSSAETAHASLVSVRASAPASCSRRSPVLACRRSPARAARRPGGLRPGLDRRLGPPWAGGVAVAGDTVEAVGDSADDRPPRGSRDPRACQRRRDGDPGLHGRPPPFHRRRVPAASVDLRPADTPEEFIARLKAYALERKPGRMDPGRRLGPRALARLPSPRAASGSIRSPPNNPVFVNRLDGHMGLANSAALRAAGIGRGDQGHPGWRHRARPAHR